MIHALKKLFGRSEPAEPPDDALAAAARTSAEFVAELARSEVWILALGDNGALDPSEVSERALLDHVERNAKELSEHPTGDRARPYQFPRGGERVQPFFSSLAFAEHYIRNTRWEQLLAFQTLPVGAAHLATAADYAGCLLVLNPASGSERTLTTEERETLRAQTENI